jgi:hypothetical protein
VLDRLETLSTEAVIDEYRVYVCGRQIPAEPADTRTSFGAFLHDRIGVIERWAGQNDIPIASLFRRHQIDSTLCDESGTALVLPTMVLAEYEGSSLRFVAPCETEQRSWTVLDRLQALGSGETSDQTEPLPNALDGSKVPEQAEQVEKLVTPQ